MIFTYVQNTILKRWSTALTSLLILAVLLLYPCRPLSAQTTPHTVTLSWVAPADATSTSAYNIYRATGACPASGLDSLTFAKLNVSPITTTTFVDSTVTVGSTYCYYGTQLQGTLESNPGNTAGAPIKPFTITIQLVAN